MIRVIYPLVKIFAKSMLVEALLQFRPVVFVGNYSFSFFGITITIRYPPSVAAV